MDGELTTAPTADGPCARKERALLRMLTSHMLATSSGQATPTEVSMLVIEKMALPTPYSFVSSAALSILTFAAMQLFKDELATEGKMTVLGGFIGSVFFIFFLTALGNACTYLLGSGHQIRIFPEVLISLAVSMFVSALVHRVCATTCLLFSLVALYFINQISQSAHSVPVPAQTSAKPHPQKATPRSPSGKNKSK